MQESSLERGKKRILRLVPMIFNNWGLKLISLVFAACLWFFVTNYQDPETVLTVKGRDRT